MIVGIIDYGSGNIKSVQKSFQKASQMNGSKAEVVTIDSSLALKNVDKIVLPGQGAFADCMGSLSKINNMVETLNNCVINKKKPFLGICVGMQLIANESSEHGHTNGFSWIDGKVKKMKADSYKLKLPHMGWNSILFKKSHPLFKDIRIHEDFYFVHSYEFVTNENKYVIASTKYGKEVVAAIEKDNIIGTQFHPEKSQAAGIQFIKNFLEWKP